MGSGPAPPNPIGSVLRICLPDQLLVTNVCGLPIAVSQIEDDCGCSDFSSLKRPRWPTASVHLISPCLLAQRNYLQGFLGDGSQSNTSNCWKENRFLHGFGSSGWGL